MEFCRECSSSQLIEDSQHGDIICARCGLVQETQLTTGERQCVRVHSYYNPNMRHTHMGTPNWNSQRETNAFLEEGNRNIEFAMEVLFMGEPNMAVQYRALELFSKCPLLCSANTQ